MKLIVFVALCIFATEVKAGLTRQEIVEKLSTTASGCVEETGASEADVEVMLSNLPAKSMEAKCLRACVMKKLNMMNGEGKLDKDAAIKMAEIHAHGDAENLKIAVDVTNSCYNIAVPDDHCEAAEKYKMCMIGEAKKHGVNLSD